MEDEWETDCRPCNADCWTCFGSSPFHCHSCFVYDYLLSVTGTFCMEQCGDAENHGMHECDDGNTANGDGCTAYCQVERAHVCTGGTANSRDTCQETCGDCRRAYEACDDCDTQSGDGCAFDCTIEAGYTCTGGGYGGRDVCYETCGDGLCYTTAYGCDQSGAAGTANYDGCNTACQVEVGWNCYGCTTTTASTCDEICEDGIVVGLEGCDDGNSVADDGCTNCVVDAGWGCITETKPTLIPSYCYPSSWPMIIDYWIEDNEVLYIKFNETVVIGSAWQDTDWSITIDGPIPPYNFSWELY
mmetsp:Transcript_19784/g.14517  ORF Transcript_19784/g.14517 Transcript_19784/m.14517 type:complete len:301 (-) Transcript_19784:513-1415(-)